MYDKLEVAAQILKIVYYSYIVSMGPAKQNMEVAKITNVSCTFCFSCLSF